MSIRSRSSSDPKTSPGAVAIHTAEAGPPGPRLRKKYMAQAVKGTRTKTSGNSGKVGRAHRRRERGYGGGQISNEEKAARAQQSRDALNRRSEGGAA